MLIRISQQLINGLSIGSIYALIAIGYSLIYSILMFSNFAHSSFLLMGAYTGFYILILLSSSFPLSLLIAMLGSGILAVLIEKIAYKPIRDRGNPTLYFIIASMGISIFFENFIICTIGPRFRSYPRIMQTTFVELGKLNISVMDIYAAVVAIAFLLMLSYLIEKTKVGIAIRAASFDLEVVGLMGVNTNMLISIVFLIAGILAGLAGEFLGVKYTVYPQLGYITNKAYIAAVFGGLGNLKGAVLGSILLGLLEALITGFLSSAMRDIFVFCLLILVLLIKPSGLMGIQKQDKV
ncbi:MAG: branched-chain amino acid transport system permease protein [Thermoanaerobacteraceae bacterium]|nr:branched-chain amino acid ABC transporter permease [Biomaibacter acetigenes]MDK2878939.1 branched-chain amino acid transport system permease protein [Thermoanaerobacteraceae bacterium]